MIHIVVPVPPSVNDRFTFGSGNSKYYGVDSKYKRYQKIVRGICVEKSIRPLRGDLSCIIVWYRSQKRGDISELWKDLLDSLQSKDNYGYGPYINDKQIAHLSEFRNDSQKNNPRVEISIATYDPLLLPLLLDIQERSEAMVKFLAGVR